MSASQVPPAAPLSVTRDGRGVYTLALQRPKQHNALDAALIDGLIDALRGIHRDPGARVVILTGAGDTFCSGGDLTYLQSLITAPCASARQAVERLAELFHTLAGLAYPTLARVQGPAYGGGVGLIACCDIAVACEDAVFAVPELRLGLIPALISPYVVAAVGLRAARGWLLGGEPIPAREAQRLGLLHEVVTRADLDEVVESRVKHLLRAAPLAATELKRMLGPLTATPPDSADTTAALLARLREAPEAPEGIAAFLEKRRPRWQV